MAKRSLTEHSFVLGVDKPAGMSSHDVVDRLRRIYGERRIGHTGTLDPAATGALLLCVGPAARLDRFLTGHDKTYEFSCVFGTQTDTDDAEGQPIASSPVPPAVGEASFAQEILSCMVGASQQLPPAYSAIKVEGKRAYEQARAGKTPSLQPREVVVHSLDLLGMDGSGTSAFVWKLRAHVSSGTYIRSLARDIGAAAGTCAHVGTLRRVMLGPLDVAECVSLEALEADPFRYLLDPVKLLGFRMAFVEGALRSKLANGTPIYPDGIDLYAYDSKRLLRNDCACTSGIVEQNAALAPGEVVAMIEDNKLKALYAFDEAQGRLKSVCNFSIGVRRGGDL